MATILFSIVADLAGDGLYEPDGLLRSDAEGPDEGVEGLRNMGIAGG